VLKKMLYPNLSGLALRCRTGADEGGPPAPPPHSAARDEVLSTDALVTMILANIRDEDGSPETVCRMVEVWCEKLSKGTRNACNGPDGKANPEVWKQLCDRVFPNWRQATWPTSSNELARALEREGMRHQPQNWPTLRTEHVPWSGKADFAKSWREWFYILCATYIRRRNALRRHIRDRMAQRDRHREEVHALEEQLSKLAPGALRENGEAQPAVARLSRAKERRQAANWWLVTGGKELKQFESKHGRTADHEDYEKAPDYKKPELPPSPGSDNTLYDSDDHAYDSEAEAAVDGSLPLPEMQAHNPFDDGGGDDEDDDDENGS